MMSFKEPQPRKQPTDKANGFPRTEPWTKERVEQVRDDSHKVNVMTDGSLHADPYIPSEGVWTMTDAEFKRELATASDAGRAEGVEEANKDFQRHLAATRADLEARAIALEWSVRYWADSSIRNSEKVVNVAVKFETYLRTGKS